MNRIVWEDWMRFASARLVSVLAGLVLIAICSSAAAQDRGFDITQYHPPVDNYGLISLDSSKIYQPLRLGAGATFHFVDSPLVVQELGQDAQRHTRDLIGPRFMLDLSFAVAFCKYYEMGLELPFVIGQDGTSLGPGTDPATAAVGDIRIHNKLALLNREQWPVGFGVIATLITPSGDNRSYAGHPNVGAEFKVVLDGKIGPVLLVGNIGYKVREEVTVFELSAPGGQSFRQQLDDELLLGLGAQIDLPVEGLSVLTELTGATLAESPFDQRFNNPWRMYAGLRYLLPLGFAITGAVEIGLVPGYGVGPAGFVVNLGWNWDKADEDKDGWADEDDKCPTEPEDEDGFQDEDGCPDPDNDADGILDTADECPDLPEDRDDFRDEDGCPDPDNDEDGLEDAVDQCPLAAEDLDEDRDTDGCPDLDIDRDGIDDLNDQCPGQPEDKDGFQDEDGCPDPDNDGDGIPDKADKCPDKAEDPDGFQDDDGCPDPDNDFDGVLDAQDFCPTQKETINGNQDDDGCPDPGDPLVIDLGAHLKLVQQPQFETGQALLKRESFGLLDQIALVIKAHGAVKRVNIRIHTDNSLGLVRSQELARARGQVLASYWSNRGLDGTTLDFEAVGSMESLDGNQTAKGRAANNRVEILFEQEKDGQ
jgi:outer membrane protein OmpA-like peptidoglycan-associated protein